MDRYRLLTGEACQRNDKDKDLTFYSINAIKRSMNWRIEFYETEKGDIPVKEFVDRLPVSVQAKFILILDLLEKYGLEVKEPYIKSLKGHKKLKEIRIKTKEGIYRVMYFPFTGRTFVMLHGFTKKGKKTPKKEIEIAEKRMRDYIDRYS